MFVAASLAWTLLLAPLVESGPGDFQKDTIPSSAGNIVITFIGHGSLMMQWEGKTVYADPYSKLADFGKFPKADLVLITHEHGDHFDPQAIGELRTPNSVVVLTKKCAETFEGGTVMGNGDHQSLLGIGIEAVPAYNLVHKRPDGTPFHPKGEGNGYILTFGKTRIYIAGDTEDTPEMKALKNIDVAFLPMNLPYTMTPEMVADAAKAFRPKVLYPYHTGNTDLSVISRLMKGTGGVELRLRKMS